MQVTCSYLELARQINQVKATRAVAAVYGANAIATVILCQRIMRFRGDKPKYTTGDLFG